MKGKNANPRSRLRLIAAIILVAGLAGAGIIYSMAENAADSALLQEMENSKNYRHELEAYGGKANVLATEIRNWFIGLWHGRSLAFTVACITIVTALGFLFITSALKNDEQSGNKRGGSAS